MILNSKNYDKDHGIGTTVLKKKNKKNEISHISSSSGENMTIK